MMQVYKFGGASVSNAAAIRGVAALLKRYAPPQVVVVVSAMGKTTNALEGMLQAWYAGTQEEGATQLEAIAAFHYGILYELFPDTEHPVYTRVRNLFHALQADCTAQPPIADTNYDCAYDRIVGYGELLSTVIVDEYLRAQGFDCCWADVRRLIITDSTWREANVDWAATEQAIRAAADGVFAGSSTGQPKILLTQGFLGSTPDGHPTTLGREGSDYTAAIFSYALGAEEMTVWKDVPGVLNADPKIFADPVLLPRLSYGEAIELTYYGATVIHPKTIKPLRNKAIPLRVRSFVQPEGTGTLITADAGTDPCPPLYIIKDGQLLLSFSPKNFSFIAEQNLSELFAAFAQAGVKVNMMQISAISFTACVSADERRISRLFEQLSPGFYIKYNEGLQLATIRHWTPEAVECLCAGRTVLLEQRNRTTIQLVLQSAGRF